MKAYAFPVALFFLAAAVCTVPAARANTDEEDQPAKFTCPVGGETFTQDIGATTFPLESYPDGGSPGVEASDDWLAECPSNGLVLMPEYEHDEGDSSVAYTAEEIARLPALIASPEYRQLRASSRATRLLWLAEQLGRPAAQRYHLLQRAAWVAKTPDERRHWMTRLADEGPVLAADPDFPPLFAEQVRFFTINALREIGRWDEAEAQIAALIEEAIAKGDEADADNPDVVKTDYGSLDYYQRMQAVILDRDTDRHPVGLMGDRWAQALCRDIDDAPAEFLDGTNTVRNCAKRREREEFESATSSLAYELGEDDTRYDQVCVTAPEQDRSALQTEACLQAAAGREWRAERAEREAEAERLLADPEALDLRCKAVTIGRFDTPATALGEACQQRNETLREQETERLVSLLQSDPAEYDRRCTWDYPESTSEDPLEAACAHIGDERRWAEDARERDEVEALPAEELAARCTTLASEGGDREANFSFSYKCDSMRQAREEAAWKELEAEPEKLAATCALPYDELPEGTNWRCGFYKEQQLDRQAWEIAKDHTALVAACQASDRREREGVLAMACERYRKCLILPIGIRLPDADDLRSDFIPGLTEESEEAYLKGRHGDGMGSYCYETLEEANAAWELVKDPATRVIDPPQWDQEQE